MSIFVYFKNEIMGILLRKARKSDLGKILELIRELADFENEPEAVEVTEAELERDGFGSEPKFEIFLAEEEEDILGMAFIYERYSTWKGKVIHLEDLIVANAHRNKGVGTALFRRVMEHAHQGGYKRVSWEVLDWNEVAINFYLSTGAKILKGWQVVQMDEVSLGNYVGSSMR